jgi:hypothetical protein
MFGDTPDPQMQSPAIQGERAARRISKGFIVESLLEMWQGRTFSQELPDRETTFETSPRVTADDGLGCDWFQFVHAEEEQGRGPFERYCCLLGTAVQTNNVKVVDVGLVNNAAHHDNAANTDNWN